MPKTKKVAKETDADPASSLVKKTETAAETDTKQEETPLPDQKMQVEEESATSDKENEVQESKECGSDAESDSDEEEESSSEDELFEGLSKADIAKMKAAMNQTKSQYGQHLKESLARQITKIKQQVAFHLEIQVSDEEATFISEFVEQNNQNLEEQLQDEGLLFLQSMQEMMEQQTLLNATSNSNTNNTYADSDDSGDEDWVIHEKSKKAERAARRKNSNKNTNLDGSVRCGRLLLNDALKNVGSMEGWSEARQKSWKNRKTSPNAYFYRFNVPGQPQRNGGWTLKEHDLFMKRVRDFGVNDQWGIFSKAIPGRVGYQCSNYWRGLVKDGDVTDPNYHYDGKKLHYKRNTKTFKIAPEYRKFAIVINKDKSKVWTNLPCKHAKHPSDGYCKEVRDALAEAAAAGGATASGAKKNKNKRKKSDGDDEDWQAKPKKKRRRAKKKVYDDDDDDEAFHCSVGGVAVVEDDNPLPGFVDIMTGVTVEKPAISPYGHVLGYDTWTKILRTSKHKNVCPFTLQKMTRRSLVKLTKKNFEQYKDTIMNITQEQTSLLSQMNQGD